VAVWRAQTCAGECEDAPEPCDECQPGNFKPAVSSEGNTQQCEPCAVHTFQEEAGAARCVQCHSSRHTLGGGASSADECQCVAGFEDVPGEEACNICLAGHFKTERGDYNCSACALGTFAPNEASSACLSCAVFSPIRNANATAHMASQSVLNCTCGKGFFEDAAACIPCVVGSFKDHAGPSACSFCGSSVEGNNMMHNTYGDGPPGATSHSHCQACPLFSGQNHEEVGATQPMQSQTDCLCFPGHDNFDPVDGCSQCEEYKAKIGFSNDSCSFCDAGHAYTSAFQACVPCALTQVDSSRVHSLLVINSLNVSLPWASSQFDCACERGHFRLQDECHECAAGFFRGDLAAHTCTACAPNYFAASRASIACVQCPANSFTVSNASVAIENCVCKAGYEWDTATLLCVACAPGSYGAVDGGTCEPCSNATFSNASAQTACLACADNEVSVLPRDSHANCVCAPGFGGPEVCSACTAATYSGGGTVMLQRPGCTACPAFKNTSDVQSTSLQQCVCFAGHGDAAENADPAAACAPCVSGHFSAGGANTACQKCGFGAVTEPALGATTFQQCMCDARIGLTLALA